MNGPEKDREENRQEVRQSGLIVYTVGHGGRTLAEFVAILQDARIETLVDVRAYPRSKRHRG